MDDPVFDKKQIGRGEFSEITERVENHSHVESAGPGITHATCNIGIKAGCLCQCRGRIGQGAVISGQ